MSSNLRASPLINELLAAINGGFRDPFCVQALNCIGMFVNSTPTARKYITTEVIDAMFRGGFKADLIETLRIVVKHCSHVREHVQFELRNFISTVLQKYSVVLDDVSGKSRLPSSSRKMPVGLSSRYVYVISMDDLRLFSALVCSEVQ